MGQFKNLNVITLEGVVTKSKFRVTIYLCDCTLPAVFTVQHLNINLLLVSSEILLNSSKSLLVRIVRGFLLKKNSILAKQEFTYSNSKKTLKTRI